MQETVLHSQDLQITDLTVDTEEEHDQSRIQSEQRHSGKVRSLPKHLEDYEIILPPSITVPISNSSSGDSVLYHISNYISYDNFSQSYKVFLAAISSKDDPKNFEQAVAHEHWREAIRKGIEALESNGTWSLETLPPGKNTVDSK